MTNELVLKPIQWTEVKEFHHTGECVLGHVEIKQYPGLRGWRIQMPSIFGVIGNEECFPTLESAKKRLEKLLYYRILGALAEPSDYIGTVNYIMQDDECNRLTPRIVDVAFSAWRLGRSGENKDDGGPCDWFNDTRPMVMAKIEEIKVALGKARG